MDLYLPPSETFTTKLFDRSSVMWSTLVFLPSLCKGDGLVKRLLISSLKLSVVPLKSYGLRPELSSRESQGRSRQYDNRKYYKVYSLLCKEVR